MPETNTAPLLTVEAVSKRFGGLTAVDSVSLKAYAGQMQCIIGANGAGKSTLFNMLCGALKPSEGTIHFQGTDITRLPLHRIARLGISRKFQVPSIFDELTVEDNLDLASKEHGSAAEKRVNEVLETIKLSGQRFVKAANLAHGQKQWLEIGIALMPVPELLLLDEPTAGMTREETRKTAELLKEVQEGITTIVIEHDMSFVRRLNCHTIVLHQGKLLREGEFSEIEQDQTVREVYLGKQ
ncbi:ATP-binding cassette domain-containing protein [Fodinicurvata sediminis]|uniref:ATP-binding cassette domain-containing protein n=1 Tax=Fodinicurvata sediminis TaxID=1121832 RepID=UPI0003B5FCB0|nr:ATP-binding cassette domain-containing protein [Fodinicurvata sediminis]